MSARTFPRNVARALAIIAALAGGLFAVVVALLLPGFICLDGCPPESMYFASLATIAIWNIACSAVPGVIAVIICLTYCVPQRRARVVGWSGLTLVLGMALFVAAWLRIDNSLPAMSFYGVDPYMSAIHTWTSVWGAALGVFTVGWSVMVARLVWTADR